MLEIKAQGIQEDESFLTKLMNKLLFIGKNEDVLKATTDVKHRKKLYKPDRCPFIILLKQ